MATAATDRMYVDYNIPLGLFDLVMSVLGFNQNNPNTPHVPQPTATREWFSQPRLGTDPTTEVITVNFKLPLSISEVGFEVLRTSCVVEIWYKDRQNNWLQMVDESRVPLSLTLSASTSAAWYKAHFFCWPVIAKAMQVRFKRRQDVVIGASPFCVGMKNGLIRRNIYTRADGTIGIEPQQDVLGNTWTSYIRDWDAAKAFDNEPTTFWKSAPMPDPMAVASLYLDTRAPDGGAQLMDTIYIDPVFINQTLNVYYSIDDAVGTRKLSPVAAPATTDENTDWQAGTGRWDTATESEESQYFFPMAWGPLISQDTWIGIEWAPDFDPTDGPASNPVLFQVTPPGSGTGQWWPNIFYDVGAGELALQLTDGSTVHTYSVALSPLFVQYAPLRIVVGWSYDPNTVYISVKTQDGTELAHYLTNPSTLPPLVSLDGQVGFSDFRGAFTAHVIKLENYSDSSASFQANPSVYVSPDPVIPDFAGRVPTTTLDNAIYAASWMLQEHGTGGSHDSHFEAKVWTPVWRNYMSQKGKLFLPQQIKAKYLKLEFANLTEQAYPVYDSGIQVSYNVFPVSVTQDASVNHPGLLGAVAGVLTLGADVVLNTVANVNWLNPNTVNNAINSIFGQTVQPISIQSGPGTTITSLPNTNALDVIASQRQEMSTAYVYRRSAMSPVSLAANTLNTAYSDSWVQTLVNGVSLFGADIQDSFTPLITYGGALLAPPLQGNDFWVFPGGTLALPAAIMGGITAVGQTIFGRAPTTETRLRFNTVSVHRYDTKVAMRDAAVAYFAGVREVQPYITTHIDEQDPPFFKFDHYDDSQFVLTNTKALDTGPITTAGEHFQLVNPNFDSDLNNWDQAQGVWTWDQTTGFYFFGSPQTVATGATKELLTSAYLDISPGNHVRLSAHAKWAGLLAANSSTPIALEVRFYNSGAFVSAQTSGISYADWAAHGTDDWTALTHTFTAPGGVNQMKIGLVVTSAATAGNVWFDSVDIGTTDVVEGTLFRHFSTTSTFAKLRCTFYDSGLVRSNDMWARQDPADTNIDNYALAYYVSTIPDVIPAGMWADSFATWDDPVITWGAPRALVAINVDPDRIFDGKRVLHFTRAGGAEEAGIKVRQHTNFVANGLFRMGAVFYKPRANNNQVTIRIRRVSDGVYIHEETFDPVVGFWYEYVTDFIEIPDSDDQTYSLELVCTGDDPDEFYLNDLYTEISHIRYFCRLGDSGSFLHDVTALRYADSAIVSTTVPVNEFSIQAAILSNKAYAYGALLQPVYLK